MVKNWRGNLDMSEEWSRFPETCDDDGVRWVLFWKATHSSLINVKIAADGRAKNKANYWFTIRRSDGAVVMSRDLPLMEENRPELLKAVREKIEKICAQVAASK